MSLFRGLVQTLQIRDDGWVEVILKAVHANNATQTFFIKDLDGDISMAHKRLAQLSLLRDAITRILPVEIDYEADEAQGNLISEVILHPRPSMAGHTLGNSIQGTVIGISIAEVSPTSGLTPYTDTPDIAGITLLKEDGSLILLQLDLQREEALTMHAMLTLLQIAHKTRRPVIVLTADGEIRTNDALGHAASALNASTGKRGAYIIACEWVTTSEQTLDYCHAFIERLGQRYESYDSSNSFEISHVSVIYTTSPAQTPEGDVSENGGFIPTKNTAWVHDDSPLLPLLKTALKKGFQVILGLLENEVHEVHLISHLGSAATPVWICVNQSFVQDHREDNCNNTPTTKLLDAEKIQDMSVCLCWKGQGYFNEGIWRFQIASSGTYDIKIDGKMACCSKSMEDCYCEKENSEASTSHAYLKGLHEVELTLYHQQLSAPFTLLAYRIR
jgi:hypothetical protein